MVFFFSKNLYFSSSKNKNNIFGGRLTYKMGEKMDIIQNTKKNGHLFKLSPLKEIKNIHIRAKNIGKYKTVLFWYFKKIYLIVFEVQQRSSRKNFDQT